MIQRLSPWQRLWGMFVVVFLASTFALIATIWPGRDAAVVADLRAPECQEWRAVADAAGPNYYPEAGEPCRAMRLFRYEQHLALHGEDDYDAYLLRARARTILYCLAGWAVFSALTYAFGVYTGRIVGALLGRSSRRAG